MKVFSEYMKKIFFSSHVLDQDEFIMEILDMFCKPTYVNKNNFKNVFSQLNKMNFFKTKEMYNSEPKHDIDSHDPDVHFNSIDSCEYTIDTEEINIKSVNELNLLTFNIRSIKKNFNNFTTLISRITSKIHVICLNESWLGLLDNINDYQIDGYHVPFVQNRAETKHGGGVITYLHKDISKFKPIKKMTFCDDYNHCLATEIQAGSKNITLLNIYRSPDYLNNSFLEKFEKVVDEGRNRICYILGDANYNLLNLDRHVPTDHYFNLLTAASFKPLITKPTRVTDSNQSLIDHIWTNDLRNDNKVRSHIIITDITDHFPCITTICNPQINMKGYRTILKRDFKDSAKDEFREKISQAQHALTFYTVNREGYDLEQRYTDYFEHI